MGFGYLLFLWSSLELVSLRLVTPDMSVTALVYLAVGILLRIRTGDGKQHSSLAWAAFLGLVLGIGYLAKTVMLPLSLGFLAVLLIGPGRFREKVLQLGIALVTLSLVAAPFVIAISKAKGYFTFGESGRLNYIAFVNLGEGHGRPVHPANELVRNLEVYEFASSVAGSIPSHYDPSYWMEGVRPRFDLRQQLKRLIWSAKDYYVLLLRDPFGVCILTCILLVACLTKPECGTRRSAIDVSPYVPLILPGILGLLTYALVLVEARYIAPFTVLLGVALFSGVNISVSLKNVENPISGSNILIAATLVFFANTGMVNVRNGLDLLRTQIIPPHPQWETAEQLLHLGVRSGDAVGVVGRPGSWSYIARVRIIAEMRPETQFEGGHKKYEGFVRRFWLADRRTRQSVLNAMAKVGVTAVIATNVPPLADTTGWIRLGNTDSYMWLVKKNPSN
jgi:4-amino-4-deoxy-L-arabinose transferase-like glycosyltransferase